MSSWVPNAISLSGQASMLGWLYGAPPAFLLYGLAADEVDGAVARATNSTSETGANLDWATSVALSSLMLAQMGAPWAIPPAVFAQSSLRARGWRPPVGSLAALLAVFGYFSGRLPARSFA